MIPFGIWIACVKYTPLHRWNKCGNETQTAMLILPNGTAIIEYTYIPWSIFESITTWYVMDIILPMEYEHVKQFNGNMSANYYTADGYGLPVFDRIEDLYNFNEFYKNSNEIERRFS